MYRDDLVVQLNLVEITKLLEYDFRKIGYCADYSKIPNAFEAIRVADSNFIRFRTDTTNTLNGAGDGNIDSVTYWVGSPNSDTAQLTQNPNDMIFYRQVNNGAPAGINLGVTRFKLEYFTILMDTLYPPVTGVNLQRINFIKITVQVEQLYRFGLGETFAASDEIYQTAYWRQMRLLAKNFNNR
jgi:hypothetical protein